MEKSHKALLGKIADGGWDEKIEDDLKKACEQLKKA